MKKNLKEKLIQKLKALEVAMGEVDAFWLDADNDERTGEEMGEIDCVLSDNYPKSLPCFHEMYQDIHKFVYNAIYDLNRPTFANWFRLNVVVPLVVSPKELKTTPGCINLVFFPNGGYIEQHYDGYVYSVDGEVVLKHKDLITVAEKLYKL